MQTPTHIKPKSPETETDIAVEPALKPADTGRMGLELGPLVVFFVANWQFGIFVATGLFMIATVCALTASKLLYGRIPIMPLVSGAAIMVFGSLTLLLQEDYFIKIKPTVVNLLFATVLFGGLMCGRSFLRYLFGEIFSLTDTGWRILTFRWALFFIFLAIINEVVWRSFSNDFWTGFKLFGVMPITMVFAISQIGLLKKHELTVDGVDSADQDSTTK